MAAALRVRRSIQDIQDDYTKGNKAPLETLMRAWKGIKALPPEDHRSFFWLGGLHGEPFRGAGWGNSSYWGGYCNHGNVLFPTWHRVYALKLEEALRSIKGCEDVTLPFWDETSDQSTTKGIPFALTQETFVLDGQTIANPLRSFALTHGITDHLSPIPDANYSKPKDYETVHYPLSGLVGSDADRAATAKHNAQFPNFETNVGLLNDNIRNWLNATVIVSGKPIGGGHVKDKYEACLNAPNYTVFSNTTSAAQWFDDKGVNVVPLESPHNSIHLAVGGFDLANIFNASPIDGANGDMGENDTASFDPIFFFHHCFVDRVFWLWQKKRRSRASPTTWRSSRNIRAPIRSTTRARRRARQRTPGSLWSCRSIPSSLARAARSVPTPRSIASTSRSNSATPTAPDRWTSRLPSPPQHQQPPAPAGPSSSPASTVAPLAARS
jgi:tyrosinase